MGDDSSRPDRGARRVAAGSLDAVGRCFALAPSTASRVLLVVLALVWLVAFAQSVGDAARYGGVDLRARVIGARAMFGGQSPYFYTQGAATPERLVDPIRRSRVVTRCTYPPTLLSVYGVLAWLPYKAQRVIWFVVEWAALLVSIGVLARLVEGQGARLLFVSVAVVFFAGGYFWRLHVERGQYYVLVTLLWAIGASLCVRSDGKRIGAGIAFGCAIALRPTVLVMLGPLWLLGRRRTAYVAALTAGLLVLITLPLFGVGRWFEYRRSADTYARGIMEPELFAEHGGPAATRYGAVVEGYDLTRMLPPRTANTALLSPLSALWRRHEWLPRVRPTLFVKLAACAFVGLVGVGLLAARRGRFPARDAVLVALVTSLWIDYFVPYRYGYADVLFLAPIALAVPAEIKRLCGAAFILIALGLLLGHGLTYVDGRWAAWLRTVGVMGGLTLCAVAVCIKRAREK